MRNLPTDGLISRPNTAISETLSEAHSTRHQYANTRLGRYLTLFDSIMEPGPRLNAFKDTFKQMFWEEYSRESRSIDDIFCGLACSIGDLESSSWLQNKGSYPRHIDNHDQYLEGRRPQAEGSSEA